MRDSYILITGALGGLGGALSHECARRGYSLYLTDRWEHGDEFARSLADTYGVRARYRACELTSPADRSALLDSFQQEGLRFSGLVNVAGRDYEGGFLTRSRQQLLYLVDLMISANLDLTHGILALRDPQQRFLLINVGSLAGFFPMPFKATYSSIKRFLVNFTLALREEMQGYGTALILCPAGLPTHAESLGKAKAQGFWGQATMMETNLVARRTIDLALKGRAVYVPGLLNRLLAGLGTVFYSPGVARFLGKRWRAREKEISTALAADEPRR